MVARRTSSAGFVAGARPDGVSGFVRRADFYAKLPSELAEGSVIGGLVSIICTMAFVWLFVAQFKSYNTVGTRTDIVVDHEADKSFQVNFKIELPELSCEWATVDVVDSLGARRFNISGEQLYKHALGSDHARRRRRRRRRNRRRRRSRRPTRPHRRRRRRRSRRFRHSPPPLLGRKGTRR